MQILKAVFFSFVIISEEQQEQQPLIIILRIHSILFIIIQMTSLLNHRTFQTRVHNTTTLYMIITVKGNTYIITYR